MTGLLTPFGASSDAVEQSADVDALRPPPVLITEQQVLFATAAATSPRSVRLGRHWFHKLGSQLAAVFLASSNDSRPGRRHYPSRSDFLEDSRMAREMLRL
jgi:hypothetical protein